MSVKFHMDAHVHSAVTDQLRRRGVDVLTAQEDGSGELEDDELLERATILGRMLFTQDQDLLREAAVRQQSGRHFAGVVYGHQLYVSIGQCVNDLEIIAKACESGEVANHVEHLPL